MVWGPCNEHKTRDKWAAYTYCTMKLHYKRANIGCITVGVCKQNPFFDGTNGLLVLNIFLCFSNFRHLGEIWLTKKSNPKSFAFFCFNSGASVQVAFSRRQFFFSTHIPSGSTRELKAQTGTREYGKEARGPR